MTARQTTADVIWCSQEVEILKSLVLPSPSPCCSLCLNHDFYLLYRAILLQGCLFTKDVNLAIRLSDAMSSGTIQVNAAPARGPDHFPFQGFRDSGIGSQGIQNSLEMMVKIKTTVINLDQPSYTVG